MKKLLLILFLSIGIFGFSQKTLEIYNYSSKVINLGIITTKPATGIYPWFGSTQPSSITINPGGSYVLQNNSNIYRFPFNSPTSSPFITTWRRSVQSTGGNGSFTSVSSNTAWTLGNGQFFNYLQFNVNNGLQGGGNIGESGFFVPSNPLVNNTYNWQADYVLDNIRSTLIFNTVVFSDL